MRLRRSPGIFFLCLAAWALADGDAPPGVHAIFAYAVVDPTNTAVSPP